MDKANAFGKSIFVNFMVCIPLYQIVKIYCKEVYTPQFYMEQKLIYILGHCIVYKICIS
jgi:hypothetical protein